ncbi:glucoamylase [Methanocrinis sp.]|uniref:glucoamylase n=1 Tax=Methanocrinis sp. TaxID=3101522 RepID=UPI003D0E2B08
MNLREAKKLYDSSVEVLRRNQHKNGGFYASPPGTRYPFIYARDHSIIVLGALEAGLLEEAKRGLEFVLDTQKPTGEMPQRCDIEGTDTSYKELQIDGNGLVLYALGKYCEKVDYEIAREFWSNVEKAVEFIIKNKNEEINLIHTINSIHEYPAYEQGFEIWANSSCCAGLIQAVKMGRVLGMDVARWNREALKIRGNILTRLYSPRRRTFIKNIRIKEMASKPLGYDPYASTVVDPDAAEYAPAYFELLDDRDLRVINTVRRIHVALWDRELGGLNRYPESWNRNNGGYGPWPHFTCQLARHFIHIGDDDRAEAYLGWVAEIASDHLLPEHLSTIQRFDEWMESYSTSGILRDDKLVMIEGIKDHSKWQEGFAYVVTPLIWPHAEYIRTYRAYEEAFLESESFHDLKRYIKANR